jgi:predicted hydrocarbon binding protein
MPEDTRKYQFSWDTLGSDMALARPNLGPDTSIEMYRLFQFTMRDILEQNYGTKATDELFYKSGQLAGVSFYKQFLADAADLAELVKRIQDLFVKFRVGIFRVESINTETMECYIAVDEDLDCSGLPDIEDVICVYDEGLIAGIMEAHTGKPFTVKEIDCWCTGARTCRFQAKPAA